MSHNVEPHWTKTYDTFVREDTKPSVSKQPPDSQRTDGPDVEAIVIIVILSIFSVVGTMGNGLVLYVFTRTTGKLISTIFILALAGTDFVTCLFIIPFTVIAIYHQYYLKYDFICKLYQFLITCNVPLSAFIMVAIAVDRFICIRHPFAHVMTIRRAKVIVAVLLSFAVILGVITALGYSIYSDKDNQIGLLNSNITTLLSNVLVRNFTKNSDIYLSSGKLLINESPAKIQQEGSPGQCLPNSSKLLSNEFTNVYQKIYSAFYLCSLLIVLVLYGLIYSSVTKQRAKRRDQKMGKHIKKINSQCQTNASAISLNNMIKKEKTQTNEKINLKVLLKGKTINTCLSTTEHCVEGKSENQPSKLVATEKQMNGDSCKERKDHNRLANIKTALMLFIVTIVFIIAFLPAWLMAHRWIRFNSVVFYMYFSYNVGNPVIYAFMNQMFRENMCKIFGHFSRYFNGR